MGFKSSLKKCEITDWIDVDLLHDHTNTGG